MSEGDERLTDDCWSMVGRPGRRREKRSRLFYGAPYRPMFAYVIVFGVDSSHAPADF